MSIVSSDVVTPQYDFYYVSYQYTYISRKLYQDI